MPNQRPYPDHAAAIADSRPVFRREGEYWTVAFAAVTCRLRDSAGLRHLAYLLARPGERIAAAELVAVEDRRQSDERSGQWAVGSGQSRLRSHTHTVGSTPSPSGGPNHEDPFSDTAHRPLPTADSLAIERARVRVTHAIRHTLLRIAAHHADLNEHLRATIKTGTTCVYLPDPRKAVPWEL